MKLKRARGPVLNREGKVIGINGIHAQPLWGDPYVYQDGTRPNDTLRQRMRRSSWAVPIDMFVTWLPNSPQARNQLRRNQTTDPSIPQVANQVDKIAKEITVLITSLQQWVRSDYCQGRQHLLRSYC